MTRTFEELAGQELDALYQGALFLSGGDARGAETLLVDTMTMAFQDYPHETEISSVERWLEARLVRAFLNRHTRRPQEAEDVLSSMLTLAEGTFDGLGSKQLFDAASAIPAWPRVALWLVLLRRWSYQEAAAAMRLEREEVVDLLRYRDVLVKEVLASSRGRPGLVSNGG